MHNLARPGLAGPRAADALDFLLQPCPRDEFLARYFERAPLHVKRGDASYFSDVYDVSEVESSMVVGGFEIDKFVMVKTRAPEVSGEALTIERRAPRARHTSKAPRFVLDPRCVLTHFDDGYTLVIKDATTFSARLQKFVNRLQQRLGFYVQTNVYFTPPKAQGFEAHHDTHDTLVMQIEGTKVWKIYEPVVALPVETQPYSKEEHAAHLRLNREVTLGPGDTLYIPHGFPHEAASAEARSLHVTLAFCPIRAIDLLEAMIDIAAVTDVELRRSLPPGWHESKEFAEQFAAMARERLHLALRPGYVQHASEMVLREMFAVTRTETGGTFDEWERFMNMGPLATVTMRDDTPYLLRSAGDNKELLLAGKSIAFPPSYGAVFERLEHERLTMREVDDALPGGVGRAFVKMLLLEGLVAVD